MHIKIIGSIILLFGRKPFADSLRENRLAVMPKLIMEEILGSSVELSTEIKEEPKKEDTPTEEIPKEAPKAPEETLETLETLSEKSEDTVPLKKYMAEKHGKRAAEEKAQQLETEIAKLRENPYKSNTDVKLDVKSLSEKHQIDEEVLSDILNASYNMTKEKVLQELEKEINPKLAELEGIKREREVKSFDEKLSNDVSRVLKDMPEYSDLVDKDDLKIWIKSGQYSKLTLPQLIEQKYSRFVTGKKTIETSHASKQIEIPDTSKPLSDEQYMKLDTDPELRKEWSKGLLDRVRRAM